MSLESCAQHTPEVSLIIGVWTRWDDMGQRGIDGSIDDMFVCGAGAAAGHRTFSFPQGRA